jgi:hypothetical protein
VAPIAADIWKLTLDAMISESEIDLAYLVWGSIFTNYLLYHNLIPSNSISSITLAYKQHLQDEGGKTDLLPSAILMADSSSKEQVLVIIVPVGLPSELHQCTPEHFLVVDSGATVHCLWDAICTLHLKEQNSSIGGIDSGSRAVCIAIGHLCGMTFCKNRSNNWSKVLITSGNHDAWVIPTSARQLFSQIRAKIQGHRCILEGPNPGLIIGATGDFIPFVLEEQTQFCLLPMYPPPTSARRHADLYSSSMRD